MSSTVENDNWFRKLIRRFAATRPMAWLSARTMHHIDRLVYRRSDGRSTFSAWSTALPVVMLTTTGAKSGKQRTLPVLGFAEGEDVIVIASNWGQRRHPSWYYNLRAHPRATVVIDGRKHEVEASEVTGADRERNFERAVAAYQGYDRYRSRAGRAGREIPVIRLHPPDRDRDRA